MAATNRPEDFDLDTAIAEMPEAHLHCRDYGHSWRPFTARYVSDQRVYEQVLRCTRCRTRRERLLDGHGQVVSSQYKYAARYVVKGMGRLVGDERGMIRLASIQADLGKREG